MLGNALTTALAMAIGLGTAMLVHEAGHFIVGRLFKCKILEFSLGIGPKLLSWTRGETTYYLKAIPFAGYVKIVGMEPGEELAKGSIYTRPVLGRLATILAGGTSNILLAFVLLMSVGLLWGLGDKQLSTIEIVMEDSPAAAAGFEDGDEIVSFDGIPTQESGLEMVKYVARRPGEPIDFAWLHEGQERHATITPEAMKVEDDLTREALALPAGTATRGSIGIIFNWEPQRTDDGPWAYVVAGYQRTYMLTAGTLDFIKRLVTGQTSSAEPVVGPIGMAHIVSRFVDLGPRYLLHLFAVFNVSIGLLNLLPIPMLDGGRFIIMGIEGIRQRVFGRDLFNKEKEAMVHFTGLVLLLLVAVVVAVGDVGRIARKEDVLEGAEEVIRQEANDEWQKGLARPEEDAPEQDVPEAEPTEAIAP